MPTAQWEPAEAPSRARPASVGAVVAVLVLLGAGLALAGRWDAGGDSADPDELAIETSEPGSDEPGADPFDDAAGGDGFDDNGGGDGGDSEGEGVEDGESAETSGIGFNPQPVGRWVDMAESPLSARANSIAVWTGERAILWGGLGEERWGETDADGSYSGGVDFATRIDGAIYDPAENQWEEMPDAPLPEGELGWFGGVWTGRELVVLSDVGGAAYDPAADRWRQVAEPPEGAWRWHGSVWTGEAVVVLGSSGGEDAAIAYAPQEDQWHELPAPPIVDDRTAGVNGRLVVYGRWEAESSVVNAITAYDPEAGAWSAPERIPVELAVGDRLLTISADPIRERVVLVGLVEDRAGGGVAPILASWRPDADVGWRTVPRSAEASGRVPALGLRAVRQGTMLWAPRAGPGQLFSYEGWAPLPEDPHGQREASALLWTGRELIVWGGRADRKMIAEGARWRFRPDEDLVGGPTAPLEPPTRGEWPFQAQAD